MDQSVGINNIIGKNVIFGKNVTIMHNCIIGDNVVLEDNVYIDSNTIIRSNVTIKNDTYVGANCILGEYMADFFVDRIEKRHRLIIGKNGLIRSGSIIYSGSIIGDFFQTGHQVTIRENANIGDHVSVGTLSDIQGNCKIGNYVRLHSNVHVGQLSAIEDFVWIFPYVVLTNDPTPPSEIFVGVVVKSFAIIATGALIMPGVTIKADSLVGAGAVVTKDVEEYSVVAGNPAKFISDIRNVKNKITGEVAYPWRNHFRRAMPWEEMGYQAWYESLDISGKAYHNLI